MRPARPGFTLIELMVVVLVIGLLAAIAIPRYGRTKDKAFVATMTSDLRSLATAQGAYFADHETYTTSLPAAQHRSSAGVTITIGTADTQGWSAVAQHASTTRTCTLTTGSGASDGTPVCN
jgi:prepilin-type N-terminal cleavage/methylation domain-containing protein